jgi:hypothetical protein
MSSLSEVETNFVAHGLATSTSLSGLPFDVASFGGVL